MRLCLACLALCLPSAAFAACPSTKADLDKGIYTTADGPINHRYSRDAQGRVLVESFLNDGVTHGGLSATMYGLYLLQDGHIYQGKAFLDDFASLSYSVPPNALPEPTPNLAFNSPVIYKDYPNDAATLFITVGTLTQRSFGACTYQTLPVTARMVDAESDYITRLHYIPTLGVAVEWMRGGFYEAPEVYTNLQLSLQAPPAP